MVSRIGRRSVVSTGAVAVALSGLGVGLSSTAAGCGSASADALVSTGDDGGGAFDGTLGGDDAADGVSFKEGDGGSVSVDAGPYLGLHCEGTPCVVEVAAGGSHICAVLSDRSVRCWGNNSSGEVGSGAVDAGRVSPAHTPTPTAVEGVSGATQIAAGGYGGGSGTSCAAVADAGVLCWGSNAGGGLGLGVALDGTAPPALSVAPLPLALDAVSKLALGGLFGCALVADGGVSCWGDDTANQLGRALDAGTFDPSPTRVALPYPAIAVATGKYHACAVLSDTSVVCWGAADHGETGQLADGGIATPHVVAGLAATQVSAGEVSTCAVTATGGVECWGGNLTGELGRGDVDAGALDPSPAPVALPAGATAVQIASAVGSTCALLSDRSVWCWGDNAYGELGSGSAVPGFSSQPVQVSGLANIVQIASGPGGWTVCALLQNGTVRCWGLNNADQLGVDTSGDAGPDQSPHPAPARVVF
jgi:hypothetical protein